MITLRFAHGTLELHGLARESDEVPPEARWDSRTGCHRCEAIDYAKLVLRFRKEQREYRDEARAYLELESGIRARREPRPYQTEAIDAWWKARGRGVVVLPTGAGKSYVAMMAIDKARRSTLIVAPTLDLVRQWYDNLRATFGVPVGIVGGGEHRVEALTVTTYDSAYLHMEHLGARFGLVVFDEAHHLPSETYALAARLSIAPEIVGPIVYRKEIVAMSGDYLADYDTERVEVELSPDERQRYEQARATYRGFVVSQGIRLGSPAGFAEFIQRTARSEEGRRAMAAYREQRQLAFCAPAKLEVLEALLTQHATDRSIVFTQDNATCHEISKRFLIPSITHQTKIGERSQVLEGLASGRYRAVVTSKVLNEGVDVPDANVAIVVSGSGSVREHVQRLGRVLRKKGDKRAILYELITAQTGEAFTSERRRDHVAYR
ncbi:MAG: DEAD/DEAH box helicase family protein [Myxococcota bacterium]|nr:DEAD/DEAH box helicase family protein [Myxococcota bacterium]